MKAGFFDLGTGYAPKSIRPKTKKNTAPRKQGCEACGLDENCLSPKMKPSGDGRLGILIIGEAPGKTEDEKGVQFIGRSGRLLKETLSDLNVDMRVDCRIINAVNCRPENNKTPSDVIVGYCRHRVLKEIEEFKPHVIIPLGSVAVQSIIGHKISGRLKGIRNSSFYSEQIPDQEYGCWVCPSYHPAYLLYNEEDKVLYKKWETDLKKAIDLAKNKEEIPRIDLKEDIFYTDNLSQATNWISEILVTSKKRPLVISYDYETTGIKPHRKGHKIVSASIAMGSQAYSFPFFEDRQFREFWKKIMISSNIKKIAHKSDFENVWTYEKLGYWVENYEWDTCIAAHCIDNKKPVGLKFLTYTNFGVIGYDDEVDEYVTGTKEGEEKKSANRFNTIEEAPIDKLLYYNALDSYLTLKLYERQKEQLKGFQLDGFKLFLEGAQSLSRAQQEGMKIDREQMDIQFKRLTKRLDKTKTKIMDSAESKRWLKEKKKELNFNSNPQLLKLFYEILGHREPEEGGKTDIEALKKIDTTFSLDILNYRKFKKIRDTYLAQYMRAEVGGVIHPFFNLHRVETFRSSSDSPNFQNIPKRDIQAKQIIRSLIKPSPGNKLIEWDYKGIEVSIAAAYTKDPSLIEYVCDKTTDMHRDMAMDLFLRTKETFTKQERYVAKNGFVFPAFYGSTSFNIAPNIWDAIDNETKTHLRESGIRSFKDFKYHVEDIEDKFWNKRFSVYRDWKQKTFKEYERKGYIDTYTGFRCWGPIKFTEVTNYPIQGSAFHCLLWTLNNVYKKIKEISGRSSIIGQIHDAMVGDIHPDDEVEADRIINLWGTEKIREFYDWIIVPLKIEKERSQVNGAWDEMEEC